MLEVISFGCKIYSKLEMVLLKVLVSFVLGVYVCAFQIIEKLTFGKNFKINTECFLTLQTLFYKCNTNLLQKVQ